MKTKKLIARNEILEIEIDDIKEIDFEETKEIDFEDEIKEIEKNAIAPFLGRY